MRILEGRGETWAWLTLARVEIGLRDQAIERVGVLGYLPSPALLWGAGLGAIVVLVHGAHRWLAACWPECALFGRFRKLADGWAEHEATQIACGLPD